MSILNVIALAGFAFLAVPILIHLIHRQRYPRVRFSTLRFFDRTRKHNVIQRRLIDIILLVLRLAAVAALVLGLARPVITAGSGARASVVIVLDNSPSMAALAEGRQTAFELARAKAADVLGGLREGDRACLILTAPAADAGFTADRQELLARADELAGCSMMLRTRSGKNSLATPTSDSQAIRAAIERLPADEQAAVVPRHDARPELTADLAGLRRRIANSRVAWRTGSPNDAVERGYRLLADAGDASCHLFVFSDFAGMDDLRTGGDRAGRTPSFRTARVRVHLANVAGPAAKNVGIESVGLSRPEAYPGEALKLTVSLRNYSSQPSGPIALTIELPGEKPVVVRADSIAPGRSRSVDTHVSAFARESFKSGVVRIECAGDAYSGDDAFYFTMPLRPTARVLCVNGVASPQPADRETFFLANALSPKALGSAEQVITGIDVRTRDVDGLADEILFQYDVIVFANVASLDEKMRKRLAEYLRDGRSVLVFLGDRFEPAEYNGWGFLPGSLGEKKQGDYAVLTGIDYDHPALKPFADPAYGDLRGFGTYGYAVLDVSGDPAARVLAKFQNGLPAIVEKQSGGGRVILCTTSVHTAWSKWPLEPAFVPLMQQAVKYLASPDRGLTALAGGGNGVCTPGDSLLAGVEKSFRAGASAAYRREQVDGRERLMPVAVETRADNAVARAAGTDAPGNYLIVQNPPGQKVEAGVIGPGARQFGFSVNVDRAESVLTTVAPEKLAERYPGADAMALPFPEGWSPAGLLARGGSELWWYLLLLMAVVVVAESVVAWRTASET